MLGFPLRQYWPPNCGMQDLFQEILDGEKTVEWRDLTPYWCKRLLKDFTKSALVLPGSREILAAQAKGEPVDLTYLLKETAAYFTVGYPKNRVPRIEVKITKLEAYFRVPFEDSQFAIHFSDIRLIKNNPALTASFNAAQDSNNSVSVSDEQNGNNLTMGFKHAW